MRTTPLVFTIAVLAIPVCAIAETSNDRSSPVIERHCRFDASSAELPFVFDNTCVVANGPDADQRRLLTL